MTASIDTWLNGASGDWTLSSGWSSGAAPGSADTAMFTAPGAYAVTLFGTASVGGLTLASAGAEFYDGGALTLGGMLALNAGTLALAYGTISGGTLAMGGGKLLSTGGTLDGSAVQGTLDLSLASTTLFVRDGMAMSGAGGSGAGSIALTGGYAALDFLGSQTLANVIISLGATGTLPSQAGPATLAIAHAGGASAGATLTLASSVWLRQTGGAGVSSILAVGSIGGPPGPTLPDALVNQGTITVGMAGATLDIAGTGRFTNQGTIAVSNGATLQIATAGFTNTGGISVVNAVLALGGTFSAGLLASLGSVNLGYGTGQVQILGTADNTGGTLSLGFGSPLSTLLGQVSLAGTLLGGTVLDSGGGLGFLPGTGVLDGTSYVGALNLSASGAAVTLTDGAQVAAADGSAGSISVTGAASALLLRGSEVLDDATILLGNASQAGASIATSSAWLASTGTTATLGAGVTVQQTATYATLKANGWSPVPGFGATDTLVNQGTISGLVAGGYLSVSGYGTFINQGSMTVGGGDTLAVTVAQFANAGTMTVSTGGTLALGQAAGFYGTAPAWSNVGRIVVAGGTLTLAGSLRTSQLGSITQTAGAVQLAGTLTNTGGTLALGTQGAPLSLQGLSLSGTILGGTVADSAGLLSVGAAGNATLDGVSYVGTLAMTGAGAFLRVRHGLALTGVADVLGAASVLDFIGSQTVDHASILLGATVASAVLDLTHDTSASGGSTLTLGSALSVTQSGALATIGRAGGVAGDRIVNAGTLTAGVAGGTFTLGGPGFSNTGRINVSNGDTLAVTAASFSNTGSIAVTGGVLSLAGSLTLAGLGQVAFSGGGVLSVGGTLDLGGGTLALGAGSAIGRLQLNGTLKGGSITDAGGGLIFGPNATLDGVTYRGTLDLSRPFSQINIAHGLTLTNAGSGPGTILLTGAVGRLLATTSETFDNVAISLGSASQYYLGQRLAPPELAATAGVQLAFGAGSTLTLSGTAGMLGDAALGQWSDGISNAGQIAARAPGTLTLGSSFFTNTGTISASSGGVVLASDVGFTNAGMMSAGAGSALQVALYNYYAAPNAGPTVFTNAGTVTLGGGVFQELTGSGVFPFVPVANLAGAAIQGYGPIFAPISNAGTIEARGGTLQLQLPVTGTGATVIDAGATLELAAAEAAGQVISFASAGGTLKIDQPSTFAGTLSGYGPGDVLDFPSLIPTGVGLASGTLVVSIATQNYRIASSTPLYGEVSAGRDAHGGAAVTFVPQTLGSGSALISVGQSNMRFWASAVGDVFQGPLADMAGAHFGNWQTVDQLDITDLAPGSATLLSVQTPNLDTLTIFDGVHTASIGLVGTFVQSYFHLTSDRHGGTIVSYGHS